MNSLHRSQTQRFNALNREPLFVYKVMRAMIYRACRAPISRRATVMLVALGWSALAFCDGVPATSEASADQLRLATLALESTDYKVQNDAVSKLTDQTLLAKIASDGDNWVISQTAAQKLTDQALLEKVALNAKCYQSRIPAIEKVKNENVLSKIALESHETGIVLAALPNITNLTLLARLAGDMATTSLRAPEAAARICLALRDPVSMSRLPDAHAFFSWQNDEEQYQGGLYKNGESIHFAIKEGSETCTEDYWATVFPSAIRATYSNHNLVPDHALVSGIPARVDITTMLVKLFSQPRFNSEDISKLALSEIPEARAAALSRVTDEALLQKVMAGDKSADVRQVAEHCLTELRAGVVPAALHNIKLDGIMNISGTTRALFTIRPAVEPGKPLGKPNAVELAEGQRNGLLEVLEIHSNEGVVKIKFDGQIYTINPKGEIARIRALK